MRARAWFALGAMCLAVTACSGGEPSQPPMEQQVHANDSGVASGEPGRHVFRCADGTPLFVDFKDGGLRLELRRAADSTPTALTAPAPGLQYVGERIGATFKDSQLTITAGDRPALTCVRATGQ